ncbi:MAG: Recombinase [Firmicutes bacterium]|nr:Recombinase [Bacillota bacterium]MDI6705059.1 recombinase family protein [Bacillota bacterium]
MKIPYGFIADNSGRITVDKAQAEVVQMIYRGYLAGNSLGGLAKMLESKQIPSPSGNTKWGRAAIDKLLSNSKYVPHIVSLELYTEVQFEKAARSNQQLNNDGTTQRKATRYNSQNVLSGLLVCAECGANYRRITQASGEVVWRCANRVERRGCRRSPSVAEQDIIYLICCELGMDTFDAEHVRSSLDRILIYDTGSVSFEYKHIQRFSTL